MASNQKPIKIDRSEAEKVSDSTMYEAAPNIEPLDQPDGTKAYSLYQKAAFLAKKKAHGADLDQLVRVRTDSKKGTWTFVYTRGA